MYKELIGMICRNVPEGCKDPSKYTNEAIQNVIIKGLACFYGVDDIVFVGTTSLRFAHQIGRRIYENKIEFKLRNDEKGDQFAEDMNVLTKKLQELLKTDIKLHIKREIKKRRLDNGFFIPKREAILTIKGIEFTVVKHNCRTGDVIKCTPYDELGISKFEIDAQFEDLDSTLAFTILECIGDNKMDAIKIYDNGWLLKQGAHVDPEFFEELVNDEHLSMLEVRFNNFIFTTRSNSTTKEYKDLHDIINAPLNDAPTINLQLKATQEVIATNVNSLSALFDEKFESKREHDLGYIATRGSSEIVDGKNVMGYGLIASKAVLNPGQHTKG